MRPTWLEPAIMIVASGGVLIWSIFRAPRLPMPKIEPPTLKPKEREK